MAADEDKTEEPTPTRLEEARSQGDVPQSRDFASFMVVLGLLFSLYFSSHFILHRLVALIHRSFAPENFHLTSVSEASLVFNSVIKDLLILLIPIFGSVVFFSIASSLGQFGFLFTLEKIAPKLDRLALKGMGRMFSKTTAVELFKSVLKVTLVSGVIYLMLRGELKHLLTIGMEPITSVFIYFFTLISRVLFVLVIFMGITGIVDLAYQKYTYAQKMRMSLKEIKDEAKQKDGDPLVRSRIRQMQRERSRARMMKDVPKADVVVTNPTHVAVAIRYERGKMQAPIVVAKGAGFIALKIKEIAAEANVPIVERKQLARFLYKNVEIDQAIPESLYSAVAEILAYVYRIKKRFSEMTSRGIKWQPSA